MLCLDMQFWNKEEGKWDFAGEPITVLEVCLEVAVASCLPLTEDRQQLRICNLGAPWDNDRGRYSCSGGHTPVLSLVGMPCMSLACHLLSDFTQEVAQKPWEVGREEWAHLTQRK